MAIGCRLFPKLKEGTFVDEFNLTNTILINCLVKKYPNLKVLLDYIKLRMTQPHFANARSVRNAIDRARMRQANRMFAAGDKVLTKADLVTIQAQDILKSRLFKV